MAVTVDVEFAERYWYPDDGGEVWLSGYQLIDPESGSYLARDAPQLAERGLHVAGLAGARHRADTLETDALAPGSPLELHRDRDNEYDANAIAVHAGGAQVGFVPRELAAELAGELDAGPPVVGGGAARAAPVSARPSQRGDDAARSRGGDRAARTLGITLPHGRAARHPPCCRWRRPPASSASSAPVLVVGSTTALVFPLREVAPVVSLGVVYLVAVLLISTVWGAWLGVLTAVASALAFNFFHIPPTGRFTIAESENWVALVVFLIVAVIGSSVAQVARARATEADQRRREADLAAEMARLLLRGNELAESLPAARAAARDRARPAVGGDRARAGGGRRAARRVPAARGDDPARHAGGAGRAARGGRCGACRSGWCRASRRCWRRGSTATACSARSVETRALRRADVVKTALLRAVSHDLRTPLTAIVAAGEAIASPTLTDEERRELGAVITAESTRLSRLIDNLLDLSRLEGGARRAAPRVVLDRGGDRRRGRRPPAAARAPLARARPPTCRSCAPTPRSSSARSPTCSRTGSATRAGTRSRCAPA